MNEVYNTLRELTNQKPSPGNDKINNIEAAKQQEAQLRDWIRPGAELFPADCAHSQSDQWPDFEPVVCGRAAPDD